MASKADNLVWIDLEMTGLDPDRDRIIEIATIVTDSHLRILVSYDLLTPDLDRQVEVMFMRINPGEHSGEEPMIDLPGEKFGYVLKGLLETRIGEKAYQLEAGDSIYFPAHFPHSWRGLGEDSIEVLWVLTPPRF